MAVHRKQVSDVTVLSLKGKFYGDKDSDELEKAIQDESAAGNTRMVFNLSEVEMLTSTPIGMMVRGFANYKGRGGDVKLCGLTKSPIGKNFVIVAILIRVFDYHDTEEQAIAAF